MSVLNKTAYFQERRDEIPNQELARELANTNNKDGIKEVVENLWNKEKNIQSDCIKVLYEIGYLKPELISEYVLEFLKLLRVRNNRLIWGAMIALSTIASLKPKEIYEKLDDVYLAIKTGSTITLDNGIKTLALIAAVNEEYNKRIFPFLVEHLKTCKPRDVPQHAEKILVAVNERNKSDYEKVLDIRQNDLSVAQIVRIKKIHKEISKLNA